MPPTSNPGIRLADLAACVGAALDGDADVVVRRVGTLDHAGSDAIAFLTSRRFRPQLAATRAAAVIVSPADTAATALPKLVHENPYAIYAKVAALLHPALQEIAGIDATASVGQGATVDPTAFVGPFAVIARNAHIGARVTIGAGSYVGDEAVIGDDAVLHPRSTLYPRCVIGARTVIHSGAVIGADGFGLAEQAGRWLKIPQIGRVVVGDDCEIGANTTIDRGAIDDTVIGNDVKLDNQIQIGHNCRIGDHTAIAGCVGIAGSATIGRNCKIGGAAMITGHLSLADNTVVSAATLICHSIAEPGVYTGAFPALAHREWQHVASELRRLRALAARVSALERRPPGPPDEREPQ